MASRGDIAGSLRKDGYYEVKHRGKKYLAHRVVFEIVNDVDITGMFIDHINGDRADNRPSNLRAVTRSKNNQNQARRKDNTSGITGVSLLVVRGMPYWTVQWSEGSKRRSRYFKVSGNSEDAKTEAIKYRQAVIGMLNLAGEDYSTRHGT